MEVFIGTSSNRFQIELHFVNYWFLQGLLQSRCDVRSGILLPIVWMEEFHAIKLDN